MMDEAEPLVKVRDLRTYFRRPRGSFGGAAVTVRAVDGVSFDIKRGTTLGLVGESGCGKTTLGRTVLRLVDATAGQVRFDGTDVLTAPRAVLRRLHRQMQIVFQDSRGSLDPRMTIGQSVAEPLVLHRVGGQRQRRDRVASVLERVGLRRADADRYPHELSGGQRQRVGIARAIVLDPKFVVFDEPVSALDVSIQSQVLNLLGDLAAEMGLTALFIAHNLAVVEHISNRVAVMYLGRIVEIADAVDLYAHPQHPYTAALLAAAPDPDPDRRPEGVLLPGDPPSPIDPPAGCALHPRCRHATEECHHIAPTLAGYSGLSPGHLVSCHHVGVVATPASRRARPTSWP